MDGFFSSGYAPGYAPGGHVGAGVEAALVFGGDGWRECHDPNRKSEFRRATRQRRRPGSAASGTEEGTAGRRRPRAGHGTDRALYAPTFEQKRELYGALREWLLVGTTEDVGSELMDLMTEIETTDLRGKL